MQSNDAPRPPPRGRFDALVEFVEVGQRLSFADAARALQLDASVLSRRIARLEARLGVRLINRTTRRVSLTEAGLIFLEGCRDAIERLEEAEAVVTSFSQEVRGVLRAALPSMFGQLHIAPLLPDFMRAHPLLRLDLRFAEAYADLIAGRVDVAVRIGDLAASGDIVARRIAWNRRLLCASPEYLTARGQPSRLADLQAHALLHFSPLQGGESWRLLGPDGEVQEVAINPLLASDNGAALRAAAVAGRGVALLATFLVGDDLRSGALVHVLPEWRPPDTPISAVYANRRFLPRKVRAFVDWLAEQYVDPPWERHLCLTP